MHLYDYMYAKIKNKEKNRELYSMINAFFNN